MANLNPSEPEQPKSVLSPALPRQEPHLDGDLVGVPPSQQLGESFEVPPPSEVSRYTQSHENLGIILPMMLPIETQTLYAEALDRARLASMDRTFGHLAGSFGKKTVSGEDFWYFRTSEGAQGRKEIYVGTDSGIVRALIEQYQMQREDGDAMRAQLDRMAAMLTHGGCMTIDPASARVVDALAVGGFFRLGGVMVGTHAYVALGNLLGTRWSSSIRTQDLDFAAFRNMEVAVPFSESADVVKSLESLNMGFLPTPGLDPRSPSTSYKVRGKELKVDLLTTASRSGPFTPVFIPRFNASALPMPYMDYLLEDNTEALMISPQTATLVRLPLPARYGLHKFLVAEGRPVVEQTKVVKDIAQASEILGFMLQMRPMDVEIAYERMVERKLHKHVFIMAQRHLPADSPVREFLAKQAAPR